MAKPGWFPQSFLRKKLLLCLRRKEGLVDMALDGVSGDQALPAWPFGCSLNLLIHN